MFRLENKLQIMFKKSHLSQEIVNASTEISRAVWAMNLQELPKYCIFKNEQEMDLYINNCCKEAIKDLQNHLKKSEYNLFDI